MFPTNIKYLSQTPRTTGAGIFTVQGYGTSHYPGNEPSYVLRSDSISPVTQAIHSPANYTDRLAPFKDKSLSKRVSYGCISGNCGVLDHLYKNRIISSGDTIYVLPEVEGNQLIEKNGKLQMQWGNNNPSTYVDQKGITRPFRYNNNK